MVPLDLLLAVVVLVGVIVTVVTVVVDIAVVNEDDISVIYLEQPPPLFLTESQSFRLF